MTKEEGERTKWKEKRWIDRKREKQREYLTWHFFFTLFSRNVGKEEDSLGRTVFSSFVY